MHMSLTRGGGRFQTVLMLYDHTVFVFSYLLLVLFSFFFLTLLRPSRIYRSQLNYGFADALIWLMIDLAPERIQVLQNNLTQARRKRQFFFQQLSKLSRDPMHQSNRILVLWLGHCWHNSPCPQNSVFI